MATIISAHIRNSGTSAVTDHGRTSGPDIVMPAQWHTPLKDISRASWIMYAQAKAVTANNAAATSQRSSFTADGDPALMPIRTQKANKTRSFR
jgi:hypothetical protein